MTMTCQKRSAQERALEQQRMVLDVLKRADTVGLTSREVARLIESSATQAQQRLAELAQQGDAVRLGGGSFLRWYTPSAAATVAATTGRSGASKTARAAQRAAAEMIARQIEDEFEAMASAPMSRRWVSGPLPPCGRTAPYSVFTLASRQ